MSDATVTESTPMEKAFINYRLYLQMTRRELLKKVPQLSYSRTKYYYNLFGDRPPFPNQKDFEQQFKAWKKKQPKRLTFKKLLEEKGLRIVNVVIRDDKSTPTTPTENTQGESA